MRLKYEIEMTVMSTKQLSKKNALRNVYGFVNVIFLSFEMNLYKIKIRG